MNTLTSPSSSSVTAPSAAPSPATRRLARTSVGAAVTTAAVIIVAGILEPGYSARSEAISALASVESDVAPLMTFGFLTMALTAVAAGAALMRSLHGKAARTGSVLVMIAGALTVVAGFARQSCSSLLQSCLDRETAGTVSGAHTVHNLVSLLLFVLLVTGGFFLAAGMRRNAAYRHLATRARIAAFGALGLMIWFGSAAYGSNGGLVEAAFILLAFGTPAYLAAKVARS